MLDETEKRLESLEAERKELLRQLKHSLAIQKLWPEAFAHGRCSSYLSGNYMRPESLKLKLRRGDGTIKTFPLNKVPKELRDEYLSKLSIPWTFRRKIEEYFSEQDRSSRQGLRGAD